MNILVDTISNGNFRILVQRTEQEKSSLCVIQRHTHPSLHLERVALEHRYSAAVRCDVGHVFVNKHPVLHAVLMYLVSLDRLQFLRQPMNVETTASRNMSNRFS